MANIAQMVNAIQSMILTDREKMLLTPTYHVFEMYKPFHGAVPCPVRISGPCIDFPDRSLPGIDASAARAQDGRLYLSLVNLDPRRSATVETNLIGQALGRMLTAPCIDSHNTFDVPYLVRPKAFRADAQNRRLTMKVPARSVVVVAIDND